MKKLFIFVLTIVVVMTAGSAFVAAESVPADTVTSATPVAETPVKIVVTPDTATTDPAVAPDPVTNVTIAPDSLLYPIKRMIESVQVALTFTAEGKAELLVSFANERLAEADLMTERNKQQLLQKVMEAYIKTINEASEKAAEAAQTQIDVKPLLDSIQITEETAGNFVIKATGIVPADVAEQLKTVVATQVKKTIAKQAATEAKDQFKAANDQVKQARENLKLASKAGTEDVVKAASDELLKAQQARDKAQELKKQAEAYKGQINESLKQDDEDEDELDEQDNDQDDKDLEHQKIKEDHNNKGEHGDGNKEKNKNKEDKEDNEEDD